MMRISACVITKNEEQNIGEWLTRMKSVAQECIVVDTGSTDNTVGLAKAAGAIVYFFPWQGDFAAAKNFALEKATGDWILFLDADEYFPAETLPLLEQSIREADTDKKIAGLICRYYNIDRDKHDRVVSAGWLLRVFRRDPAIRYAGAVHEQLEDSSGLQRSFSKAAFVLYHTGYSSSLVQAKLARNMAIIRREIAAKGEQPQYYPYMMEYHYGREEYEAAAYYARKALDFGNGQGGQRLREYLNLYESLRLSGHAVEELQTVLAACLREFPEAPEPYCQKGILAYTFGKWLEAEKSLKLAERYWRQQQTQAALTDIPSQAAGIMPHIFFLLGNIAEKKGRPAQAQVYYHQSLAMDAYQEDVFRAWYSLQCAAAKDAEEILSELQKIYHLDKDKEWLAALLGQQPYSLVYLFLTEKVNGYEAFMGAGEYRAAAREAAGHLEQIQTAANGFLVSKSGSEAQRNAWQLMLPVGRIRQ